MHLCLLYIKNLPDLWIKGISHGDSMFLVSGKQCYRGSSPCLASFINTDGRRILRFRTPRGLISVSLEKSLLQKVEILQSSQCQSFMLIPPLPVSPLFCFAFFLHLVLSSLPFSSLVYHWVLCRLRTQYISL